MFKLSTEMPSIDLPLLLLSFVLEESVPPGAVAVMTTGRVAIDGRAPAPTNLQYQSANKYRRACCQDRERELHQA